MFNSMKCKACRSAFRPGGVSGCILWATAVAFGLLLPTLPSHVVAAAPVAQTNPDSNAQAKVDETADETVYQQTLAVLQGLADQDQWVEATALANQTLLQFPDDQQLIQWSETGQRIEAALNDLKPIVEKPERLETGRIRQAARERLKQWYDLRGRSAYLDDLIKQTEETIKYFDTPVQVLVVSDGQTDIVVRYNGKVGRAKEKTISLTPGSYLFEGIRPGFKSCTKQVKIDGQPTGQTVEFSCTSAL